MPDYAQLAEAYGCAGFTVENEDELEEALAAAFDCGPQRRRRRPLRPRGEVLPDGARRRRRGRRRSRCPTSEEVAGDDHAHHLRASSRTSRGRWRASRSSSRGAATTSRASPSGRPSAPDISRLTLRVDCSEHSLEQIEKQMHKLVNVLRVTELPPDESVERELALITVAVAADKRAELSRSARSPARASPTSAATRSPSSSSAVPSELEAFEELVRPYGVRELVRTGRVGLRRPERARPHAQPPPSVSERNQPWPRVDQDGQRRPPERQGRRARLRQPGPRARAQPAPTRASRSRSGCAPAARRAAAAEEAGPDRARPSPTRCEGAQLVAFLVPDGAQAALLRDEVAPNLEPGAALLFAHGFNVHYGRIDAARGPRRDHGRAEGPGPRRPPPLHGGLRHAGR